MIPGLLVSFVAVLMFFQNCGQTAFHSEGAGRSLSENFNIEKMSMSDYSVGAVQFFVEDLKTVTQVGRTYQVKFEKTIEINVETGEGVASNNLDNTAQIFCVPTPVLAQLNLILQQSDLCRYNKIIPPGTVCAQVYQQPYAKLLTTGEDIDLGSAADSCESQKIDLCGEASSQLRQFIDQVQREYSQYSCF